MAKSDLESKACSPAPLDRTSFNSKAELPHGLAAKHIGNARINQNLSAARSERLTFLTMESPIQQHSIRLNIST
jgi:hypothetical protein